MNNPLDLHKLFGELTGLAPVLNITNDYAILSTWIYWLKAYTADDLRLVVRYLKKRPWQIEMIVGAMKFNRLVGDPVRFGELLAEARAWERNRVRPGPPTFTPIVAESAPQTNHSRHVSKVIAKITKTETFAEGMEAMRKAAQ